MILHYVTYNLFRVIKPLLLIVVAVTAFQGLLISAYEVVEESEFIDFFLNQIEVNFGTSLDLPRFLLTSPLSYMALGWRHPFVIILLASFVISRGFWAVAGELEGGYGELLFTRPTPRWRILGMHLLVTMAALLFICLFKVLGTLFFTLSNGIEKATDLYSVAQLGLNSFFLYGLMASYSYLFSVLSSVKGVAAALAAGTTLFFYFLEVMGDFWALAKSLQPLSIFHYYQPFSILLGESDIFFHLLFLILPTILLLLLSFYLVEKRDL